ncbi:hypothetical protein SAMN05216555_104213 [Arthrobacter cupressi]|uniref:Uncharacterized protein n=1 Tax=Arthrobacter cupressi TaxID=1045773 RepID=A0A1G8NCZ4_9MICC|nr:hypothetical protein [Arthrobacter cupressi]SDI78005.1 hypothetical protein SAMN05216555_104213 [Arthrobacter cupressi]
MHETNSASASFREIDEGGNALPHDPASAPEGTRRFRVNPFILALWVLNGALMVAMGWVYSETIGPAYYGAVPESSAGPLLYILMNSVPQVLLLTALTSVALLFWHAWHWQRRRANQPGRPYSLPGSPTGGSAGQSTSSS